MKIYYIQITSASTLNIEFTPAAPICILRGQYSDLALDLIHELISCYGAGKDLDRFDDGRFVIHSDIEMDGKSYRVCYIRNADYIGDKRLAVNFEPNSVHFSEDDTREFISKCKKRDADDRNVLIKTADIASSEDDRPILIYDYFDRLDKAFDITPVFDELASLGRQVFISVCAGYPEIKHEKVQMVHV